MMHARKYPQERSLLSDLTLTKNAVAFAQIAVIWLVLYSISNLNASIFHALCELITITIAFTIFVMTWNTRGYYHNDYFLIVGIAGLSTSLFDLVHVLSYTSFMESGVSSQIWIAARYISSLSFFGATFFINKKTSRPILAFVLYATLSVTVALSIFVFKNFPTAYIDGLGSTPFRAISEYIILALFALSLILLYRKKRFFGEKVSDLLMLSLFMVMLSELLFVLYPGVYDSPNVSGNLFRVAAAYFLYLGVVEVGLVKPYRLLFKDLKDRESTLIEKEIRYRSLVELSPDAVLVHRNGIVLYINPAGLTLFGKTYMEEVVGKHVLDFVHPDDKEFVDARIKDLALGKQLEPGEYRILREDGSAIDVSGVGRSIFFEGTKAIQSIIRDVTASKRTEKELRGSKEELERLADDLRKFQLAVHRTSDHVIITDAEGKILYANRAAERMTGFTLQEMLGKTPALWGRQMPPEFYESFWRIIKEEKRSFKGKLTNIRKDGTKYDAHITVSPVLDEDGSILFFVGIERDITKEEAVDKAKTEFVSLASHQLRTPLASIGLSADLLLRGVAGKIAPEQREYLEEIHDSIHRMADLIGDLLNVSRIEMGTFVITPERMDIAKAVHGMMEEMLLQIEKKGLHLKISFKKDVPAVLYDEKVLRIIVENLLSNAIRYTEAGGEILVSLERKEDMLVLSVADTGCGIPKEARPRIFEKVFRAENAKNMVADGAGLGLYLTRGVVLRTGGTIWFEPRKKKGTSFYVTIPIREK